MMDVFCISEHKNVGYKYSFKISKPIIRQKKASKKDLETGLFQDPVEQFFGLHHPVFLLVLK